MLALCDLTQAITQLLRRYTEHYKCTCKHNNWTYLSRGSFKTPSPLISVMHHLSFQRCYMFFTHNLATVLSSKLCSVGPNSQSANVLFDIIGMNEECTWHCRQTASSVAFTAHTAHAPMCIGQGYDIFCYLRVSNFTLRSFFFRHNSTQKVQFKYRLGEWR